MDANPVTTAPEIDYVADWQSTTPAHAAAIKAFWLREGALSDEAQAHSRIPQVIMHATDASGAIVAVCTAERIRIQQLQEWMYYYRSFVSAPWRKHGIAITMLQRAEHLLSEFARERNFPCIGILLAVESTELRELTTLPYWPRTRFTYVGRDPAQRKCYVRYFDGAMLS